MSDRDQSLARIADALERLAGEEQTAFAWTASPAYTWGPSGARTVHSLDAPPLDHLFGIDRQKTLVTENVARLASGAAAHDMLLWGARGMGKSALVRASVLASQAGHPGSLALVQVATDALETLPRLFVELGGVARGFLVFIDDLGFAPGDDSGSRRLRSWLEGGVEARPANARLAVTSNRRSIVTRNASEQDDPLNPRDEADDALALADRFGLSIGFHAASQEDYLAIVRGYAEAFGLPLNEADALAWARQRGTRSGRTAWQYTTELAGREGRAVSLTAG